MIVTEKVSDAFRLTESKDVKRDGDKAARTPPFVWQRKLKRQLG